MQCVRLLACFCCYAVHPLRTLMFCGGNCCASIFAYFVLFCFVGWAQLGAAGEAFFVERVHNPPRRDLVTSPLSSPLREGQEGGAEAGGGGGGGRQWEESAGQDDWES